MIEYLKDNTSLFGCILYVLIAYIFAYSLQMYNEIGKHRGRFIDDYFDGHDIFMRSVFWPAFAVYIILKKIGTLLSFINPQLMALKTFEMYAKRTRQRPESIVNSDTGRTRRPLRNRTNMPGWF